MNDDETRAAFAANPEDPRHGTTNGYGNLKCRCPRCREANRVSVASWRETRPDLYEAKRARMRASRLPRSITPEIRERFAQERADLALKQAAEMDALIDRQMAEAIGLPRLRARVEKAKARVEKAKARAEKAEARALALRRQVELLENLP